MKTKLLLLSIAICAIANAQYAKLHDFSGAVDGQYPYYGSLISDGVFLYGMTTFGGTSGMGVIFKIKSDGSGYAKLFDFSGANGRYPYGSLISDGVFLYGMTTWGGTSGMGAIFKIKPDGSGYAKLFDFSVATNGYRPLGSLISDGVFLYGMTNNGGTNDFGVIFKIKPDGSGYAKLLDFSGAPNGSYPYGSLISDGTYLYGMTYQGGTNDLGVIFKIKPDGSGYAKLLDFSGAAKGSHPFGHLISDGDFLYGMTQTGGINDWGVIFKIKPDGSGYAKLFDFSGAVDGKWPQGSLISDGTCLYGMTNSGGTNSMGTVFKYCGGTALAASITSQNILCNGQCTGTAATVVAGGSPSYTYSWSLSGGSASSVTGLCAGTYTVTVTDGAGSTTTAAVTIMQPTLLTATAIVTNSTCDSNNGSTTITAGGGTPGYTYSWNPSGGTNATAPGLGAGNYTATVTDANGCTITQTVSVVSSGSVITTGQSASVCSGSTYTLPGGMVVSTGGAYIDTLTSVNGCDSIITTTLTVNPNPTATAFSNTTITQGQSVTLTASGGGTYSWSSGTSGSSITVTPPVTTVYCVTVTDANGCTDDTCVTVTVEQIDCSNAGELYLPNAFSPNNDGENDKLQIYYGNIKCIKTFNLVIYNRWGEKVFENTNPIEDWDGFFGGRTEGAAVFVYYMEATLISGEKITKKGNISLIK